MFSWNVSLDKEFHSFNFMEKISGLLSAKVR